MNLITNYNCLLKPEMCMTFASKKHFLNVYTQLNTINNFLKKMFLKTTGPYQLRISTEHIPEKEKKIISYVNFFQIYIEKCER